MTYRWSNGVLNDDEYARKCASFSRTKDWCDIYLSAIQKIDYDLLKARALDLGCNTGHGMRLMQEKVRDIREVYGADVNESAIKHCRIKGFGNNARLIKNGALPFKDNQFDLVMCSHVWGHVEDRKELADEIMRVTTSDAYIISINPNRKYDAAHWLKNIFTGYKPDPTINRVWDCDEFRTYIDHITDAVSETWYYTGEIPWWKFGNTAYSKYHVNIICKGVYPC